MGESKYPTNGKGKDGSEYWPIYPLTHRGRAICLPEYSARLAASGNSTHVILLHDMTNLDSIQDIKLHHVDPVEDFHELVLTERSGLERLTFSHACMTE